MSVFRILGAVSVLCATAFALPPSARAGTPLYRVFGFATLSDAPMDQSGTVVRLTGPATLSAMTKVDGGFEIINVPMGTYTVTAERGGYETVRELDVLVDGETQSDLELRKLVRLSGQVVVVAPPAARAPSVASLLVTLSGDGAPRTATTDAAGAFVFADVPAGDYTLSTSGVCLRAAMVSVSLVSADVTTTLSASADASTLSGRARRGGQSGDQSDIAVRIRSGAETLLSLTTDPLGRYGARLCRGTYTVVASAPGYREASAEAALAGSDTTAPELVLPRLGPFTISGTVTIAGSTDRSGVRVELLDVEGASATSDASGRYGVSAPAGRYTLRAQKVGLSTTLLPDLELTRDITIDLPMVQAPAPRAESPGCAVVETPTPSWPLALLVLGALLHRTRRVHRAPRPR